MSMTWYLFWMVLITGAVTFLLRAFPFLAFGRGNKPPEIIRYLGDVVSPAAIAMLVVYCYFAYFKARPFSAASGWNLPEVAAGLLVIWLHHWKTRWRMLIIFGIFAFFYLFIGGPVVMPRYQIPALPLLCAMAGTWFVLLRKRFVGGIVSDIS